MMIRRKEIFMKKIKLLMLMGMASLLATGCSAGADADSNQAAAQEYSESSAENPTENEDVTDGDTSTVNTSNNDANTEDLTCTAFIDKESAVEVAEALWETTYGDLYTDYVEDLDDDDVTVELNTYNGEFFGGETYWYVTVIDGEYGGGFCAYINAVTGECKLADQFK